MDGKGMQGMGMQEKGMQGGLMSMMSHEQMMAMHNHMQKMRQTMSNLQNEKDPSKRKKMMKEHMERLQQGMLMMNIGAGDIESMGMMNTNQMMERMNQRMGMKNEIDELSGVDGVWLNESKKILSIKYEASHLNIDDILAIFEKHGAALGDSWWSRIKLGWQRQTDQKNKDNSKHVAHCCNKSSRR